MDNRIKTETEGTNNIVVGPFALMKDPVDVQLTKHITNLLVTYGPDGLNGFRYYLHHPGKIDTSGMFVRSRELINYYGYEKCRQWFTLIYGWEYEKVG
jgi:hypothetical protein